MPTTGGIAAPGAAGVSFAPPEPASCGPSGSPFAYPAFCDGMLVTAADLTQLYASLALKQRILAAFMGPGTLVGLRVARALGDAVARPGVNDELVVASGLALDGVGRLIFVEADQCLDLEALLATDGNGQRAIDRFAVITPEDVGLAAAEGLPQGAKLYRAYVVLRYACCPSDPAPALANPCGPCDATDVACFGRIQETFRIDLMPAAPRDPCDVQREWLEGAPGTAFDGTRAWLAPPGATDDLTDPSAPRPPDRRDRLLEWALGAGKMVPTLWASAIDAPLLLAEVILVEGRVPNVTALEALLVDDSVRAVVAPPRVLAEEVFGQRLGGRPMASRFVVESLSESFNATPSGAMHFEIALSDEPRRESAQPASVTLALLGAAGWKDQGSAKVAFVGKTITIDLVTPEWAAGTVYQLRLSGAGPNPIVRASDGRPLAGTADEPSRVAHGRDVSIVRTYKVGGNP